MISITYTNGLGRQTTIHRSFDSGHDDSSVIRQWADVVERVEIDGVELVHVLELFIGIPKVANLKSGRNIMTWYGDDAKFICGNIS